MSISEPFAVACAVVRQRLATVEATPPGQWANLGALDRAWIHLGTLAYTWDEQHEWTVLGERIQAVNDRRAAQALAEILAREETR